MRLVPGKRYITKSEHIVTVQSIVNEPDGGDNVGDMAMTTIDGPRGPQMELYYLDGKYRKEEESDWDIVKELPGSPKEFHMEKTPKLFDENGQRLYAFVEKALVWGRPMPPIRLRTSSDPVEGYQYLEVMETTKER